MSDSTTRIIQDKAIMMKLVPLVFTLVLFFILLPVAQLDTLRAVDPIVIFTSIILFIAGIVLLIEFARNWNDAKQHNGAKSGAITFLVTGIAIFLFGLVELFGQYNIYENAGKENALNIVLVILLGIASIMLYAGAHPEIRHRKTLAKAIRTST